MPQHVRALRHMEFYDWVSSQNFRVGKEFRCKISGQEQEFLQDVIYPMFYAKDKVFGTANPFPIVLADYCERKPLFVIDNAHFTIIFFSYDNFKEEYSWAVSMQIKDHDFCDKRISKFKTWYREHYGEPNIKMAEMPAEFQYSKLDVQNEQVQNFSIEFCGIKRDFLLFKLMDLLRVF